MTSSFLRSFSSGKVFVFKENVSPGTMWSLGRFARWTDAYVDPDIMVENFQVLYYGSR